MLPTKSLLTHTSTEIGEFQRQPQSSGRAGRHGNILLDLAIGIDELASDQRLQVPLVLARDGGWFPAPVSIPGPPLIASASCQMLA